MTTSETDATIAKLYDPHVQSRVMQAARSAINEQLREEGIDLTPELLAEIAARSATSRSSNAAEILATGAVFIGTLATILWSDERLKHNMRHVGVSKSGINVYEFSYVGFSNRWRGVSAQELQKLIPDVVVRHPNGFLMVDYEKIDVPFSPVTEARTL